MKKFFSIFMTTIIALLVTSQLAFASNGYDVKSIDNYVGQKIINLDYFHSSGGYYPYRKRLDSNGNLQCVGYAYARLEEKLGLSPSFSSGAGGKDIPNNAPNGATRTAIDGSVYTIEVYKNDGGSHIVSDCWVSFGAGNSSYGHVIYVEEVIGDNVYYTESGTSMWKKGTTGTLRKKSMNSFINNCSSGGQYVGTVVFRLQTPSNNTCTSHSYNKSGYCTNCGAEYSMLLSSVNATYQATKDGVPVRNRPYATDTTISTLSKGRKVTVVASGKNSEGNLWYKTSDGTWIYSGNLEKVTSSAASTLAIDMTSYPSSIKQGSSYGLRGSVTSNYNITSVNGYVINSSNSTVLTTSDTPNSKSMDVKTANLNDKMTFNSLSAGTYTMKIVATDSSGKSKEWSTTFSVTSTATVNTRIGIVNIPSSWTDLSIRTGPSTNYQIVGSMPNGARCTVYPDKASNGWYYVEYNGVRGYAAGNRINLQ